MNIFRLLGDLSHLLAVIILLVKIWRTRSCSGISGKSQILFAVVYTARYLDLITAFISPYNTVMKIVFLAASYATLYLMYLKFKATYDHHHDTFRIELLLIPCACLALLVNHAYEPLEILWTFSIYLESVAILPQLFLVSKTGEAESITSHYLFALGSYRGLYILNWIYRYYIENHYDLIAIVAGIVQTVLYCDFFYLYITKAIYKAFNIPVPRIAHVCWKVKTNIKPKDSTTSVTDVLLALVFSCCHSRSNTTDNFYDSNLEKVIVAEQLVKKVDG